MKTVSRSVGRSATAAAAYRAGEKIVDARTGTTHDYTRKRGIDSRGIVLPEGAPQSLKDRSTLWNEAEKAETRKNSTVAREFEIALPAELDREQRRQLVRDFAQSIAARHGCAVDVAIHRPTGHGEDRNHHAHLMLTTRRIGLDGFGEKTRELDERKSGEVDHWRAAWADMANRALERAGHKERIDHRRLEVQGIDREPTRHLGPKASAMERRGIGSDRGDENREIRAENDNREQIKTQIIDLEAARKRDQVKPAGPINAARIVQEKQKAELAALVSKPPQRPSGARLEVFGAKPVDGEPEWKNLNPVALQAEIWARKKRLEGERKAKAQRDPRLLAAREAFQRLGKERKSVSGQLDASMRESALWRQKSPHMAWLHDRGWFEDKGEKKRQNEQGKAKAGLKDIDFQKEHWKRQGIEAGEQALIRAGLRQSREREELSRMEARLKEMECALKAAQERELQRVVEEAASQRAKAPEQKPDGQGRPRPRPGRGGVFR